jgi:hypothetical protein
MEELKAVAACGSNTAEFFLELRTGQSELRKTFNKLKVQLRTTRSNGISYIEVTECDAERKPTTDQDMLCHGDR